MEFIDTHAHIYLEPFDKDIREVMDRARKARIMRIYLPNIDRSSISPMLELADTYPQQCRPMMGLHPCSVNKDFEKELSHMENLLDQIPFAGIGETGTDLYWDRTYREQQTESLRIQIEWAKKYKLPIILHSRDSLDLTISIIEEHHSDDLRGIFHCFTGSVDQACRIKDLGFMMGIGGVLTFKNSKLDTILSEVPLSHIVLETDSPFLAPHPHRGKRNEPSHLLLVAETLAGVYQADISEIAKITTGNARKIFKEVQ